MVRIVAFFSATPSALRDVISVVAGFMVRRPSATQAS
jgi:hypothetical protein